MLLIGNLATAQEHDGSPATNVTKHKRIAGFNGKVETTENKAAAPTDIITPTGTSAEAGITEGSLSVSLAGAANYSIPLIVPRGITGVEPKISLDYSSQAGNGIAGYGWNIGGLSSITRIPSTQFHDGVIDPVDMDDFDRFALDGQRLILKNPTGTAYLFDGAIFETENFSNIKVTYFVAIPNAYFLVEYPDGTSAKYGNTASSQSLTTYGITEWKNAVGIAINFTYVIVSNFITVSMISYGSVSGQTAANTITFIYEARLRPEETYINNNLIVNNKILTSIEVNSMGALFRGYYLLFNNTVLNGVNNLNYQQLNKITESARDGSGVLKLYNPTVFKYETTPEGIVYGGIQATLTVSNISIDNGATVTGDFDGDGSMDFLLYPTIGTAAKTKYWVFNDNTNVSSQFVNIQHNVGAFDGMFAVNMLNYPDLNNKYKISQSQGWCIAKRTGAQIQFTTYLFATPQIIPQYTRTFSINSYPPTINSVDYYSGDFNGDGLTDVFICKKQSADILETYFINLDRRISTDFGTVAGAMIIDTSLKIYVSDANGDGKSDLLFFSNGLLKIYSLTSANYLELIMTFSNTNISTASTKTILIGDYNGDGKSDFLINGDNNINNEMHMFYNTGTTFNYQYKSQTGILIEQSVLPYHAFHYISHDFNHDGKSDITKLYFGYNGAVRLTCVPNKNGWFPPGAENSYTAIESTTTQYNAYSMPIFYNASQPNESLEIGFIKNNKISTFRGLKDFSKDKLLSTITTGNGVIESISYKPLKQELNDGYYNPNIYKPTNTADSQFYPNADIYSSPSLRVVSKLERFGNNYKNQFFSYYGGVYSLNGLGFLGFQEVLKTNWYDVAQPQQYMICNVAKFDMTLRGANTLNFSTINYWTNMGQIPSYCLSKTVNTYNIENGIYTEPLLANKVFKLKKTQIVNFDGLKNISSENNIVYNVFNNPLSINETIKNGTNIEQTSSSTTTYDGLITNPYTVDRPTIKTTSLTAYGDTRTTRSEMAYTSFNQLLSDKKKSMNSDFITTTYDYDPYGNIRKQTINAPDLAAPRITNYIFDPSYNGRFLTKVIDIESLETNYTYDNAKGNLLSETNPFGLNTTTTYDCWGKKKTVKDYLNNIATINYAKTANNTFTVTQTMPTGHGGSTVEIYDLLGRKIISGSKNIQGIFNYVKTDFDNLDRVAKKYEPYFLNSGDLYNYSPTNYLTTKFDIFGRLTDNIYNTGKTETMAYDLLTTTVTTTADGLTTTKAATTDAIGNTISTTEAPLGGTINHQYYANGVLKSTNYAGNTISMLQDNWGRKSQLTDRSAGTYKYTYNNLSEILTEESPKGITTYGYDNFGKVLTTTVVGKSTTVPPTTTNSVSTNVYDPTTKLLYTTTFNDIENNLVTNYLYEVNSFKQPKKVTETSAMCKFETEVFYDSFGRPLNQRQKAETFIAGTTSTNKSSEKWTTNVYQRGSLFKITDGQTATGSGAILWQNNETNERGQLTKAQFGNGIFIQNTYDAVTGNLTNLNHTNSATTGGTSYFQMSYNWTSFPQRNLYTSRTFHHNNNYVENFTFDNLDRLTSYPNELGVIENQTYAESGRIASNSNGTYNYSSTIRPYRNTSIDVNVASKNYYLNSALQQINYSALKKPISIYQETTTSVAKERLDFLYNSGESRSTMFYGDSNANRMARKFRRYYSQGGTMEITEERNSSGAVIATDLVTYVGGDAYSAPVIVKSDGANQNFLYLHRDNIGSILAISDQNKNILERRMFDAWGNLVKLQNATGQFVINNGQTLIANYKTLSDRGFTGHEHLFGIGLINMNGRLYDPKLHRFLMPDNNLQDPSNSQNYNRYAYVLNNPLMNIDPSGEEGGPGDGGGIPNNCANCGMTNTQQSVIGNTLLFVKDNWGDIKDWSNRNLNFNDWSSAYHTGMNFVEKNIESAVGFIFKNIFSLMGLQNVLGGGSENKAPTPIYVMGNSYSFAPSGGTSSYVSSVSTSPGGGYNSAVEMHPYAQQGYQEKGAINNEVLNFKNTLLNRFEGSGVDPYGTLNDYSKANEHIYKVINNVKGLKEYYKLAGSPKAVYYGTSTDGWRGYTSDITQIYNGAFTTNYMLASTLFHEFTHSLGGSERAAYSTEWRLADKSLRILNQGNFYYTPNENTGIWNRMYRDQGLTVPPYPHN